MNGKASLSQEQPAEALANFALAPSVCASPKRICHVVATTEGAVWVYEQLRDLRDRFGYDVSVILNGPSGTLVDRFKDAGIPVLTGDFDFLGVSDLFALPRKIIALARTLRRERFDVVQTHLFHSMVIGRIGAWLADVPVRLSMVAGPFHLEAYTPRWIDGSTQWMDTALIPSCEWTRKLYKSLGVAEKRLALIYYGPDEKKFDPVNHKAADLRREFGLGDDGPLIGMIAYFYAELGVNRWTPPAVQGRSVKCQSDVIRAMPEILEEFPKARLVLVGSGWEEGGRQYLSKMQSLVRDLNLTDRVTFTGYRTDVPEVLKALDVTVQASLSENLGGTIEGTLDGNADGRHPRRRPDRQRRRWRNRHPGRCGRSCFPREGNPDRSSRSRQSPAAGEARSAIYARAFHAAQNGGKRARALSKAAATVAARLPTTSNVCKAVLGGRNMRLSCGALPFHRCVASSATRFRLASLAFR